MNFNERQPNKTQNNESNSSEPTHEAEIIALISGKGGVGKTAIAGSMASLIGQLGYKVLLADADVATHGMSYFFVDQVQKAARSGLIVPLDDYGTLESRFVHIGDNFDFVPSKIEFQRGERLLRTTEEITQNQETFSLRLIELIGEAKSLYDFIIVDCQAGAVASTYEIINRANRVVSVLEADPVGVWASRSLDRAFGDVFPEFTFYLVNKLFLEEVSQYNALTDYLRIFAHLPPLPFDFEVRRAFARRVLPTDSPEPSAFGFGLIRTLKDLFPMLEPSLVSFERDLRGQVFEPTERRIDELDSRILELSERLRLESHRARRVRTMFLLAIAAMALAVATFVMIRLPTPTNEISFMLIMLVTTSLLAAALEFSGASLIPYIRKLLGQPESSERKRESLNLELERLREERKALVTYLATMSKDLMLPQTNVAGAESHITSDEVHHGR